MIVFTNKSIIPMDFVMLPVLIQLQQRCVFSIYHWRVLYEFVVVEMLLVLAWYFLFVNLFNCMNEDHVFLILQ